MYRRFKTYLLTLFCLALGSISYAQLSGTVTVGLGDNDGAGDGDFANFKSANGLIATINAVGLSGNLLVQVDANIVESGSNSTITGANLNGFSLTINPIDNNGGSGYTITLNANGIRFTSCSDVTIDGSFGGTGRFLTWSNPIDNGETFELNTRANNLAIQNCIIESNTDQTQEGAIELRRTSDAQGFDNITIHNNLIRDAAGQNTLSCAVYITEPNTAGVTHDNIVISNNDFEITENRSIYLDRRANTTGTISNCSIIRNSFYSAATVTLTNQEEIIRIEEADSITISGNYFGGTGTKASGGNLVVDFGTETRFKGIYFLGYINTTKTNILDSNVFRNIRILGRTDAACDVYAIQLSGGKNSIGKTYGNFIGDNTADAIASPSIDFVNRRNGSDLFLIQGAGNYETSIAKNTIGGIRMQSDQATPTRGYIYTIYSNGTKDVTISENTVGSGTQNNSIYQATDRNIYGIYTNANGAQVIDNNTIAGIQTGDAFGNTGNIYGIRTANAGSKSITNNIIGNTSTDASGSPNILLTTKGGDTYFYGINAAGNGTSITITGNTVAGVGTQTDASTERAHLYNIYTAGTQSGNVSIQSNQVGSTTQASNIYQSSRGHIFGIRNNAICVNLNMSGNTLSGWKADTDFGDNGAWGVYVNNISYTGSITVNNNVIGNTTVDASSNPSIDLFAGYADPTIATCGGIYIAPNATTGTTIENNTIAGFRLATSSNTERLHLYAIYTNRNPSTTFDISQNLIGSTTQNNSMIQSTSGNVYGIYSLGQGDHTFDQNTIAGIQLENHAEGVFRGIFYSETVNANITVTDNVIGSTTADASTSPSIKIYDNTGGSIGSSFGIYVSEGINVTITGNTVAGISSLGIDNTVRSYFRCIYHGNTPTTGNLVIDNNTLGSTTTARNIYKTTDGYLFGIQQPNNAVSGSISISNNTIQNFSTAGDFDEYVRFISANSTSSATTIRKNTISNHSIENGSSTSSTVMGIHVSRGVNTIDSNTISNIIVNASLGGIVLAGIYSTSASTGQTISNNRINGFSQTNSSATSSSVRGIHLTTANSGGSVFNNIIRNFSHATTGNHSVYGAYVYNGDWDIYNNVILFGDGISFNTSFYGMFHRNNTPASTCTYRFNTIEIKGTVSSGGKATYAFWRSNHSNNIELKNNILSNVRSGGGGNHYAVRNQLASTPWDADYNALYSVNSSTLGRWGATNLSFTNWKSTSSNDANAVNGAISLDADGVPATASDWSVVDGKGVATPLTMDLLGVTRDLSTPDIGAYERIFVWTAEDLVNKTDWFDVDNWSSGTVPISTDNISIPASPSGGNFYPDINAAGAECGNLIIESGASLTISGTENIDLYGIWTNYGSFTPNQSTLSFVGPSNQKINSSAPQDFYNLTLNNASGADITTGEYNLIGTLTLTNGTFTTNDSLTLISDASGTARIAEITGGSISGDITMQRYIDAGATNWRFLTSAVSGTTLADFNDDFITSGFIGSDFPDWPTPTNRWPSIYFYDETIGGVLDDGFVAATNVTNPLAVGEGLWVWCGDSLSGTDPFTIDITGPANTGSVNLPMTYTDHGSPDDDGWNMVGNPYPSTIDWDDASITKTNINNAVYIWNPDLQQYASYVGGIGTNGGSKNIASSQAFWIQASAASPVLQVTESSKTVVDGAFLKKGASQPFTVSVEGSYGTDQTIINFDPQASNGFDGSFDAHKIISNSYYVPAISTVIEDTVDLSINQIPNAGVEIPVKVTSNFSDSVTIHFDNIHLFKNLSCILLKDNFTDMTYDVQKVPSFNTFISDTTKVARFTLSLGVENTITSAPISCFGSEDGTVSFEKNAETPFAVLWKNALGDTIKNTANVVRMDSVTDLLAGTYFVETTDAQCANKVDTVSITGPPQIVAKFTADKDTIFLPEGTINFDNRSSYATTHSWEFGDGNTSSLRSPAHRYEEVGEYEVTLAASQNSNCSMSVSKVIVVREDTAIITNVEEVIRKKYGAWIRDNHLLVKTGTRSHVQIRNVMGQLIAQKDVLSDQRNSFDLANISSQTLFITIASSANTNTLTETIKINYVKK